MSGGLLAVCSCTVLPLFAGIHRMGAGLGPAVAFLYSGPAINILAIILTARVLGTGLGIARAVGAIAFAVVIGLAMELLFREEEASASQATLAMPDEGAPRPVWQSALLIGSLVAILVFANIGEPARPDGPWAFLHEQKWRLTVAAAAVLLVTLRLWFDLRGPRSYLPVFPVAAAGLLYPGSPTLVFGVAAVGLGAATSTGGDELGRWFEATWDFAKQILPLLLIGVLIAGFLLGRPGGEGIVPASWVTSAVGGNGLLANFLAAIAGAFMYFATLTEIPILQGLLGNGMGQGPALALLLAGPALSLPNMLVIASVLGWKKTSAYVLLVVTVATLSGLVYGNLVL